VSLTELIQRFHAAKTPGERNHIAIELGDSKTLEAKEALVQAMRDPSTKGQRGTLVYALWEGKFDCSDIVPELVECVVEGSYEEVEHALTILGHTETSLPEALAVLLRARLWLASRHAMDWRAEAIDLAIGMLD
jgi:hypothetical protein